LREELEALLLNSVCSLAGSSEPAEGKPGEIYGKAGKSAENHLISIAMQYTIPSVVKNPPTGSIIDVDG
jgi:hypothetical protein